MRHTADMSDTVDFRRSLPPVPRELHQRLCGAFQSVADDQARSADISEHPARGGDRSGRGREVAWATFRSDARSASPDHHKRRTERDRDTAPAARRFGGLVVAERLSYGPLPGSSPKSRASASRVCQLTLTGSYRRRSTRPADRDLRERCIATRPCRIRRPRSCRKRVARPSPQSRAATAWP